jgi:CMP-N-acetylneuraminic acid synthetase
VSRTIAFVPSRGGSKRVPHKNMQRVGGLRLVDRAIVCALDAGCDLVVVSTDDPDTAHAARAYGSVEVHDRPVHLASDTAQIEDAIAHWLHRASPVLADDDVLVLAQPTSPFRRPETIRECVRYVREHGCDSAIAVRRDVARVVFHGRIRGLYDEKLGRDVGVRVLWNNPADFRPRTQDCENDGPRDCAGVGAACRAADRDGGSVTVAKELAVAALPALVMQVGEAVREHLRAKREAVCAHGRPGGRLCPHCSSVGGVT